MADDQTAQTEPTPDDELQSIINSGEAGVGDLITVYEQVEARYFAAVSHLTSTMPTVTYATHT